MTEKIKIVSDLLRNNITMYIKPEHPQNLINIFCEDEHEEPIDSNYKPPINQFIESVNELGLNLSNDLTEEIINEAYLKCVTKYQKFLQGKIEPEFKISVKETAWEYLINSLRLSTKVKNMK
jgi:ATP-dependent helicase YprA (DUF1998 family)